MYIPSKMTKLRQELRASMRVVNPRFVGMVHDEMNRIHNVLKQHNWPLSQSPRVVVNRKPQMAAIEFRPNDQISVNFPQIKTHDQLIENMRSAMVMFALKSLYDYDMEAFNRLHSARGAPKPALHGYGSPRYHELLDIFAK